MLRKILTFERPFSRSLITAGEEQVSVNWKIYFCEPARALPQHSSAPLAIETGGILSDNLMSHVSLIRKEKS